MNAIWPAWSRGVAAIESAREKEKPGADACQDFTRTPSRRHCWLPFYHKATGGCLPCGSPSGGRRPTESSERRGTRRPANASFHGFRSPVPAIIAIADTARSLSQTPCIRSMTAEPCLAALASEEVSGWLKSRS